MVSIFFRKAVSQFPQPSPTAAITTAAVTSPLLPTPVQPPLPQPAPVSSHPANTQSKQSGQVNGQSKQSDQVNSHSKQSGQVNGQPKQSGPVNGDECYFWRTTGCSFGDKCRNKHVPDHRGVDKKPWQKTPKWYLGPQSVRCANFIFFDKLCITWQISFVKNSRDWADCAMK